MHRTSFTRECKECNLKEYYECDECETTDCDEDCDFIPECIIPVCDECYKTYIEKQKYSKCGKCHTQLDWKNKKSYCSICQIEEDKHSEIFRKFILGYSCK